MHGHAQKKTLVLLLLYLLLRLGRPQRLFAAHAGVPPPASAPLLIIHPKHLHDHICVNPLTYFVVKLLKDGVHVGQDRAVLLLLLLLLLRVVVLVLVMWALRVVLQMLLLQVLLTLAQLLLLLQLLLQ